MVDYFVAEESRLFIFNEPIRCHICLHEIFIPYQIYPNFEKPGIQVIFTHYAAICQQCGFVIEFGGPSGPDQETGIFRWALDQQFIHEQSDVVDPVPVLADEVIAAQKRCIHLALQLLVQGNIVTSEVLEAFLENKI